MSPMYIMMKFVAYSSITIRLRMSLLIKEKVLKKKIMSLPLSYIATVFCLFVLAKLFSSLLIIHIIISVPKSK